MPYSITTRDGITIQNIPDEVPADHPSLKDRVSKIRGQSQPPILAGTVTPDLDAPTSGIVMGMRDPIDAGAQMLRRIVPERIGGAIDSAGNWLASKGFPVAPSSGVQGVDNIVKSTNAGYEANRRKDAQTLSGLVTGQQPEPGFDWSRLVGNMLNPANYVGGGAIKAAQGIKALAFAGAKAGGASAALQPVLDTDNFWGSKAGQVATGAATGAVATPAIDRGAKAAGKAATGFFDRLAPGARAGTDPGRVTIAVNNTFASQGMSPSDVPEVMLQSINRQVKEALDAGAKIDPKAIMRKAQFEAVGLSGDAAPTLGQATRDPMQWANEKNLSGVRIKTARGEGNPLADRFQLQNQRLGEVFDQAGASGATDRVTAGQSILGALRKSDEPVKAGVDDLYNTARSMTGGRAATIDSAAFSQSANSTLDEGMWGHFVPPEIRNLLNDVTSGKTPLTVETATQMDSILSAAQRRAGQGSPQASAIGVIRKALHDAPMAGPSAPDAGFAGRAAADAARTVDDSVTDVAARMVDKPALPAPTSTALAPDIEIPLPRQGREIGPAITPKPPPIDEGEAARKAFEQARKAARDRFATIDKTPALKAALEDEAPDHFVRNYILNADVRDVESLKAILKNSPEALNQARAQIADHLKRAAFGENPSADKAFTADRYLNTVRSLGKKKLEVFFTPAEIVRLNLAGKVASDINSIPVGAKYGTNTSGTGAAVMNLLSKLSESPIMRKVPGARMIANQIGEIQTERKIEQALRPAAEKVEREAPEQLQKVLQLPMKPAAVAGGAAASPTGQQRQPDFAAARAVRSEYRAGKLTKQQAMEKLQAMGFDQ
jgi:hypothetical protein